MRYADELRAAYPRVEWLGRVAADDAFFSRIHAFALIAEPEGCPNASLRAHAEAHFSMATMTAAYRALFGLA